MQILGLCEEQFELFRGLCIFCADFNVALVALVAPQSKLLRVFFAGRTVAFAHFGFEPCLVAVDVKEMFAGGLYN